MRESAYSHPFLTWRTCRVPSSQLPIAIELIGILLPEEIGSTVEGWGRRKRGAQCVVAKAEEPDCRGQTLSYQYFVAPTTPLTHVERRAGKFGPLRPGQIEEH